MAPLTRFQRSKICWFGKIPVEIALLISKCLPLKDKLIFCDTSRICRSFVSERECIELCKASGLKLAEGVSPRAMAKLLAQPRKGVCNWSHENGVPKDGLDFSQVWSVTRAMRRYIKVVLHPAVLVPSYMVLRDEPDFNSKTLHVARGNMRILLHRSRLYMHEYLTSPPLDEIRVFFQATTYMDIPPLNDRDVAFRIGNLSGVTLGNLWEGMYEFLDRAPDREMQLSKRVAHNILDELSGPRYIPLHPDLTYRTPKETRELGKSARESFKHLCRTNCALLDVAFKQDAKNAFTEEALSMEIPLISGQLELMLSTHSNDVLNDLQFIENWDRAVRWGEPVGESTDLVTLEDVPPWPVGFWEKTPIIWV